MNAHEISLPVKFPFVTRGVRVLMLVAGLGLLAYIYRLVIGLSATNLDNQYPWGIWIAMDVAAGVALAAAGFTVAALAHIFHRDKYRDLVRPALLTAMLGYTFVVIGLLADLGRYYNVWHPILPGMWQGNSVLFEVGMCVMIYLSVLYIEFVTIVTERFKGRVSLPGPMRKLNGLTDRIIRWTEKTLNRFISLFIIAGVVLSCLHQSSLGTLMVIAPTKMHPLWYTDVLPLLFLLSAIAVGFPVVILESLLTSRSFRLRPEIDVLASMARYVPLLLGAYLGVKIIDLTIREAWPFLLDGSTESFLFMIELAGGVILPLILLSFYNIRNSAHGLLVSAFLVIFGVILNRIDVFLVAYSPLYAGKAYFPSIIEIAVTVGLAAMLILLYRTFVMIFPVVSQPSSLERLMSTSTEPDLVAARR
jgi:Ni/Fe-hydrogenase subunit HybB-like protein